MQIHLGCGQSIRPGFLNIDMLDLNHPDYLKHDLTKGLPYQVKDVTYVYSAHFWEHMTDSEGLSLMFKVYDRMTKGGTFRICLPDFYSLASAYLAKDWDFFNLLDWNSFSDQSTRSFIDVVSFGAYQFGEHKSLWDKDKIQKVMSFVGFKDVWASDNPNPTRDEMIELRTRYSIYAEGTK